jgi:ubiquinone/menaquinone biosynthesis C-methylase UbiE
MQTLPKFWSNYLAGQFRKPSGFFGRLVSTKMERFNKAPYDWVRKEAVVAPNYRVLEIGFGPGYGILEVAKLISHGAGCVCGIDFSKSMYKKASKRHRSLIEKKKVRLEWGDAAQMPFEDNFFDLVFAVNVTYFWPRPKEQLMEVFRVLRPSGTVCIYFTNNESLQELPMTRTGVFHFHERRDLTKAFDESGFIEVVYKEQHITEGRPRWGCLVFATRHS